MKMPLRPGQAITLQPLIQNCVGWKPYKPPPCNARSLQRFLQASFSPRTFIGCVHHSALNASRPPHHYFVPLQASSLTSSLWSTNKRTLHHNNECTKQNQSPNLTTHTPPSPTARLGREEAQTKLYETFSRETGRDTDKVERSRLTKLWILVFDHVLAIDMARLSIACRFDNTHSIARYQVNR